jgi:tRNA(Ile)-lysidine synthase
VRFSAAWLRSVLEEETPAPASGFVVAISGGADSACLLTALVQAAPPAVCGLPVRAVHVDHALQPAAADFRLSCETLCLRLGVPLAIIEVRVDSSRGVSLEAAAREARYAGIGRHLSRGECLLTAHHAGDQAESLLLQLLRGAGVKGLAAMPPSRPFEQGFHLRPLLGVTQPELRAFGAASGVAAVADPMNDDLRFDRNFLRARVWPRLEERWPGAAQSLARAARHFAGAQELLDDAAARELNLLRDGAALSVTRLRRLSAPQRQNVLRHWIAAAGVLPPASARLAEALRQVLAARDDHQPAVTWHAHALRRYRDRLFLTPAVPPRIDSQREWPVAATAVCELGPGLGSMRWVPQRGGLDGSRLPPTLLVRRRGEGETLKPQRRGRSQSVQHLCQALGVLPWMRDALPHVYAGEHLVAVGDLWRDARWCVAAGESGMGVEWRDAPVVT